MQSAVGAASSPQNGAGDGGQAKRTPLTGSKLRAAVAAASGATPAPTPSPARASQPQQSPAGSVSNVAAGPVDDASEHKLPRMIASPDGSKSPIRCVLMNHTDSLLLQSLSDQTCRVLTLDADPIMWHKRNGMWRRLRSSPHYRRGFRVA